MIQALAYLQFHSVKNRLVTRFKRLKQPKYFVGAIVGGAYFYFYFFRFLFRPQGFSTAGDSALPGIPTDPLLFESMAALILFGIVVLTWIIPHQRAALTFTEAEVAFLFPAPIGRRGLIQFKLARSQLALLITVFFFTFVSQLLHPGGRALQRGAAWWLALSTLNLHFLGSSFARTMLLDRGISNWTRRAGLLLLLLAGVVAVGLWTVRSMPELNAADLEGVRSFVDYFQQALVSGPLPYLLYPFRLMVRPYFAADGLSFLAALWPAVLVLAVHYFWVVRSDVAFEEASVEASKKVAEAVAAARSGNLGGAGRKRKPKRPPFTLRPAGPAFVALLWKNLINAGSAFTARIWITVAVVVGVFCFTLRGSLGNSNWAAVLGGFFLMAGIWGLLLGPQIVRQDFRQDLPNMDLLKVFPLRGWQVALGEILAPVMILTSIHWLLLIGAMICAGPLTEGEIPRAMVWAIGFGVAVIVPVLNALSLLIPNGAVLLFPAWFQAGRQGPHGIEATGQRLIFALGQFLAFGVSLIPATVAFIVVFFLAKFVLGPALAVAVASVAATLLLAVEVGLGVLLLGRLFERFDLSHDSGV